MRYMTDDDKTFTDHEEAKAHEAELKRMAGVYKDVEDYLDTLTWYDTNGRARTRLKYVIHGWLEYDIETNPDRYSSNAD